MKTNDLFNINKLMTESIKTVNEINPHNYDSDWDYYDDLHGDDKEEEYDGDGEDDDFDDQEEPESHYEKFVRVRGLGEQGVGEEFIGEPDHDGSTFKNSLHTIHRVAVYLNKNIRDDDDIPEWVAEKMGAAKGMLTSVMQYLISEKEMHRGESGMFEQGVAEGSNYAEQLAQQVFNENPNLVSSGSAEEVLGAAYTIARDELGDRRARMLFTYNEDFPGDLVTNYAYLQKQSVAQKMPKGNYSDEAHPIRDDGNEGQPGKQRYPGMKESPDYAEMFESKLMEFASAGGGAGGIATSMSVGKGSNVGTLFGGNYSQKNSPFKAKKPKKSGMIKR